MKNLNFVLYSENIDGIKEYEKVNDKHIKLKTPVKIKMIGVYKHPFPCSLNKAIKNWECIKQILKLKMFYHSIIDNKLYLKESGTKFNIFLLPIIYLYSLIDTKKFTK